MDAAGLTITLLHEIYNIVVFIKDVYTDTKNYDTDRDEISFKLSHELQLLRFIGRCFFDSRHGLAQDQYLADHVAFHQAHISEIVLRLRATLEVYGKVAEKHFEVDIRADETTVSHTSAALADDNGSINERPASAGQPLPVGKIDAFRKKIAELKKKSFWWALFDKAKLTELVANFKENTDRLKEIYSFAILDVTRLRGHDVQLISSQQALDLGLASSLRRQEISRKVKNKQAVDASKPLGGCLEPAPGFDAGDWKTWNVFRYRNDTPPSESLVMAEYKRYRPADIAVADTMTREQRHFMQIVRSRIQTLAILLEDPFDEEQLSSSSSRELTLHTFKALGYHDQPEQGRFALLFKLPPNPSGRAPVTLEQLLDRNWKFQLEERFFLAHCLGKTLFTLHSSDWLHKNIRCTQVVVFLTKGEGFRVLPYLTGFEYSRPSDERTDGDKDYDIVRNIYRHPMRQGYPREDFRPIHDIFAFGILLLELGMRRTMTKHFSGRIKELEKIGELPEPEEFPREMVKLAEKELAATMGRKYKDAVLACLTGDFGVEQRDLSRSRLAMAFRDKVLAVLELGMTL